MGLARTTAVGRVIYAHGTISMLIRVFLRKFGTYPETTTLAYQHSMRVVNVQLY